MINRASHRLRSATSFFESNGYETFSGASFGSQWCRKTTFENISGSPFWDPGPSDPRGVPRDQYFWIKIFLISSSCDLILCIFGIGFAKKAGKSQKHHFGSVMRENDENYHILAFCGIFLQNQSKKTMKFEESGND